MYSLFLHNQTCARITRSSISQVQTNLFSRMILGLFKSILQLTFPYLDFYTQGLQSQPVWFGVLLCGYCGKLWEVDEFQLSLRLMSGSEKINGHLLWRKKPEQGVKTRIRDLCLIHICRLLFLTPGSWRGNPWTKLWVPSVQPSFLMLSLAAWVIARKASIPKTKRGGVRHFLYL